MESNFWKTNRFKKKPMEYTLQRSQSGLQVPF